MAHRSREAQLSDLFATLDRAALEPTAWSAVCDAIAELVGAVGTLLLPADPQDRGPAMPHSLRLGEAIERYLAGGWHRRDFRAGGFAIALQKGSVTDHDLIRPEAMDAHPYYAELLAPVGLKWFAGVPFGVGGKLYGAAVHRGAAGGPFHGDEIALLASLPAHLALAARRAAAFGASRLATFGSAFAAAQRGVAAIGWSGRIVSLDARAEALVRDFALVRNGRLASGDAALDARLRACVEAAIAHRPKLRMCLPGPLLVPAADGHALCVDAIPMPRDFQSLLAGAAALVTLHEVAMPAEGLRGRVRKRFRLTAREAELAAELAAGRSIGPAAAALGISVWTARQHLKSVFTKTGAHRQAELVAMLAQLSD